MNYVDISIFVKKFNFANFNSIKIDFSNLPLINNNNK